MKALIAELNDLLAKTSTDIGTAEKAAAEVQGQAPFSDLATFEERTLWLSKKLSKQSAALFTSLPSAFAAQLLAERDPHGNVQVSLIESEKLFISMVKARLAVLKEQGTYKGKFSALAHFFGYEGRCAFPSNFDADYCYSLGLSASLLIAEGLTGYISSVRNLTAPADQWQAGGVPLTMMMNMEQRLGKKKPVIKKALVELNGRPFKRLEENRARWAVETCYQYPGAIQYFGPSELADRATITLGLEH
jgi:pyrophosphate--fructose-6-phosphate 1-phosphotransferase